MARSRATLQAVGGAGISNTYKEDLSAPEPEQSRPTLLSAPASLYLMQLDETSRKAVRHRLDVVAGLLQPGTDATTVRWETVTYDQVLRVKAQLGARYHWNMANHCLSALKGVLRVTWQCGIMGTDAFHRAVSVPAYRGSTIPHGRHVQADEFQALFGALAKDDSVRGKRDLALFGVARSSGARCEELVNLSLSDLDLQAMTLRIDGKGRRERLSVLASWCRAPLAEYLKVRGTLEGPLFSVLRRNGRVANPPAKVSLSGMQNILEKRIEEYSLQPFTWHDFRRSAVSDLLESGAELRAVMLQVGHSNPKTTMRYDRRETRKLQEQARNIESPFGGGA